MVSRLKEEVSFKLGRDILNRGDCELLSKHILTETGHFISYNTLRRFFELNKRKKVKPRVQTLNILCQYIGYKDFDQFLSLKPQQRSFDQNLLTAEVLSHSDPDSIRIYFESFRDNNSRRLHFLIELIRDYLWRGKFGSVGLIIDALSIELDDFSYDEKLYLGNMIGLSLRRIGPDLKARSILFQNEFLNTCLFEIFVDYSSLNGYYTKFISAKPISQKQRLFKYALKQLRQYVNNKPLKPVDNSKKHLLRVADLHPVLLGRLFSLQLLTSETKVHIPVVPDGLSPIEFWYEPMVMTILTSDFRFFSRMNQEISLHLASRTYRSAHYFEVFFLMKACYCYKTKQLEKAEYNLSLINTSAFRMSYKEMLMLFVHLVSWKIRDQEHDQQAAIQISKQLNYPRLSMQFLDAY